jgi:hypothetical protein
MAAKLCARVVDERDAISRSLATLIHHPAVASVGALLVDSTSFPHRVQLEMFRLKPIQLRCVVNMYTAKQAVLRTCDLP